jgi:hypothetical protein
MTTQETAQLILSDTLSTLSKRYTVLLFKIGRNTFQNGMMEAYRHASEELASKGDPGLLDALLDEARAKEDEEFSIAAGMAHGGSPVEEVRDAWKHHAFVLGWLNAIKASRNVYLTLRNASN